MRVRFLHIIFKVSTVILLTLQSLVKAFRIFKIQSSRAYGWATPSFVRRSYVIDIANCLNNDVDMTSRKKAKLDSSKKVVDNNSAALKLHKEFQNLTAKDHIDNILNSNSSLKSSFPHKRSIHISYEEDYSNSKFNKKSVSDILNVKEIIDEIKSEGRESKNIRKTDTSTTQLNVSEELDQLNQKKGKVNNFPMVDENICSIPNFSKVWNGIANKRNKELAPVDTYGSHCLAEPGKNFEFQTLVACMLSSQTKDEVTASCMEKLKERGLTLENILKMDVEELDSLISKVGFHSTKAKNIKKVAEILKNKYGGKVPSNKEDLESLPGIGPKMANLIQQIAFNVVDGIAVDLHVHRITNRLGWVKTKTPEETRLELEELLPKSLWNEINPLLVGFGQTFCTAAGPGCPTCPVNKWCPTGISNLKKLR